MCRPSGTRTILNLLPGTSPPQRTKTACVGDPVPSPATDCIVAPRLCCLTIFTTHFTIFVFQNSFL